MLRMRRPDSRFLQINCHESALVLLHHHHSKPVLLFGHLAPFVAFMAASALHSSTLFQSQAMHPPSPEQGLRQKAAIGAVETMEGNNARTNTQRTDALDASPSLRSRGPDHRSPADFPRR